MTKDEYFDDLTEQTGEIEETLFNINKKVKDADSSNALRELQFILHSLQGASFRARDIKEGIK